MTSKTAIILTGMISLLLISSSYVFAKGTCLSYVDRIPGITLDDAQKKVLEDKAAEYQKKMIQLKADHAVARVDKDETLKNKAFKKDAVQKNIRKMMDIETQMEMTRLDALDELRKVLTDEQWNVFISHKGLEKWGHGNYMHKNCPMMGKAGHGSEGKKSGGHGGDYGKGHKSCPYSNQTAPTTP